MKRIAAVIVTYNNAAMLEKLLNMIAQQRRRPDVCIVVDNASGDDTSSVAARFPEVEYVRMDRNTGSAGGYAEGLRLALARGCDLVWTLDDDVSLFPDSLEALIHTLAGFPEAEKVCAVRSVGKTHPWPSPTPLPVFPWRGTLITSEAIRRAGPPDSRFFLYGEDLEYSLRLASLGYRFFWAPASRCIEDRLKGKTDFFVFGRRARVYAEPLRHYYAFRNEIYIYLRYRRTVKVLEVLAYALKIYLFFLLLHPGSAVKITKAVFIGILDGVRGRLGERAGFGTSPQAGQDQEKQLPGRGG